MLGTYSLERLQAVVGTSLLMMAGRVRRRPTGELQFDGQRPGPGWHAHGYCSRFLEFLEAGRVVRRRLFKRRWKDATGQGRSTRHSRPEDELPSLGCCALIVVLQLWSWMDGDAELIHHDALLPGLERVRSTRTIQRWMRRLRERALELQQAIRAAIIERCEPRPMEQLFEGGLSPPAWVRRRWRKAAPLVDRLWTAFAMMFGAAIRLEIPASVLLAEARRRLPTDQL